jgi:cobalt-zinc-cadmium efflux system outer membrane protein
MAHVNLPSRAACRRPTIARCFAAALLAFALPGASRAMEPAPAPAPTDVVAAPLTEEDVVQRAVGRAPLVDALEGAVEVERGVAATLSAYPNPQLSYLREQTFGSLGTGEDYVSLSQVVDLGSRRSLRGSAAERRADAIAHEGEAVLVQVAAEARLRFYEVLHRQHRADALRTFGARIDTALEVVARREARGDAALYDRRRLERERAVAGDRLEAELATLERARARLVAILDGSMDPNLAVSVTGEILPPTDPPGLPSLRESLQRRPELRALESRRNAASLDRKAAGRWWVPDLRVEGGWKGIAVARQGRTDGFLLGAAVSLPLWNASAGLARTAEGEARIADGRRELLEAELLGEITGLRAEAVRLAAAARRAKERSTTAAPELVRIASAGYEGGELSVLELLDSYRGSTEDELAALELAYEARRARIELDRAAGEVP